MVEFIDCRNCGKRVRESAERCHHCQTQLAEPSPEHSDGGYDSANDDFDYDEYLEKEFESKPPIKKIWVYAAWLLIIAFLTPIVLQLVTALNVIGQ
jgi:hypothetical protein